MGLCDMVMTPGNCMGEEATYHVGNLIAHINVQVDSCRQTSTF